ncbi:hypothetical protein Tco_1476119 [Tanacetum coccineum]
MCKTFKEFNYLLQIDPDLLTKDIERFRTYEEYKDDRIYEWNRDVPWANEKPWTDTRKNDGYCDGGNLHGAYIIGNSLHYQDYEWYEALMDCKMKEQALRNKAIMEGLIMCNMRRFKMINYSFGRDEEYAAIKEDEYDDLVKTCDDACRAYQEIFRMIDERWMVTRAD